MTHTEINLRAMSCGQKPAKTVGERAFQPALQPFSPFKPKKRTASGEKRRLLFVFSGIFREKSQKD